MYHGLGNYILIVNDAEAMRDLLEDEKRQLNYCDRPTAVMVCHLAGASRVSQPLDSFALMNPSAVLPFHELWEAMA